MLFFVLRLDFCDGRIWCFFVVVGNLVIGVDGIYE